jgi:ABC-type phosphate transport system substrate-binding protein
LTLVFLVTAAGSSPRAGADPVAVPPFRVIVNPSNPVVSVDRRFLLEAFLGKTTRWSDDRAVRPVDLPADSATRRRFSDDALRRSVSAVKSYWLQVVFSGHGVPPPELDSDGNVVKFVLRTPGAIGYVSGAADLEGAKPITVREP